MSGKETTVLDIREILRHLQQGRADRAIARALGLSRPTVAKYRQWAAAEGLLQEPLPAPAELQARLQATHTPPPPETPSTVEPYRAYVIELRERGTEIQAVYQRLWDRGYRGTYSSVWRFVRRLEPVTPEATVRVETAPGEEAQIDFGYVGRLFDPVTQSVRRAWAFVMTLSWSRHQYVEFVFDQSVPTWLRLHRQAFEFFGGVPRRLKVDNLKAAIGHAHWEDPAMQRAYRDLAEHYGCLVDPCRVATPRHKGKVESGVHYVQRNFLGGRTYDTLHADVRRANREVLEWVRAVAGPRCHGTTKQSPLERFTQVEQAALLPLPAVPFEEVLWKQAKLGRDCYVTFDNAYYSAPHRLIGQVLWLRATATLVQIYHAYDVVATHTRASQPGSRQTVLAHLPPEKVAGLTLTPESCQARAVAIGPRTAEVVAALLAERPLDRLRAAHRLVHLAEKHTPARLERACARALRYDDLSVRTIRSILERGLEDAEVEPAPDWPKFARRPEELVPTPERASLAALPHAEAREGGSGERS